MESHNLKHLKANLKGKSLFQKELRLLMYGFGDHTNPRADTVNIMEDLLIDYIVSTCHQAHSLSETRGKVKVEDFKFLLRKDLKKTRRIEELLHMSEDIRRAKQLFDRKELEEGEDPNAPNAQNAPNANNAASTSANNNNSNV
ncbi:TFIID-18kDa-domain-containing protein [Conidiobolus coronatus NRRL 28638]|uniref:Transcription initiation factor TFIID subunit 13 n=1 Tax=Conidiobolus coronatus (strain ATCC 28846 / CBS 209.66 / NRRL 28638) TaxID=796925 RepID=A0A137PI68_CONC2|nr:TFIID-18kDa-domain-containing protein [Conidiobolus coronatus NRRL 28638]|eukprot:KXN74679.1 TFIID-18kDa-domain-containing protein [Conidiobolus coronatus NRRL 28638]